MRQYQTSEGIGPSSSVQT